MSAFPMPTWHTTYMYNQQVKYLQCKAKRHYLLTLQVSRYCILALLNNRSLTALWVRAMNQHPPVTWSCRGSTIWNPSGKAVICKRSKTLRRALPFSTLSERQGNSNYAVLTSNINSVALASRQRLVFFAMGSNDATLSWNRAETFLIAVHRLRC